jgi:transcriptional regulator NrdR family protein
VRFASVYHDFTGVRDFERFIQRMASESERAAAESDADVAAK